MIKKITSIFAFAAAAIFTQNVSAQITTQFEQNFETFTDQTGLSTWTSVDRDNDTKNWFAGFLNEADQTFGRVFLISQSVDASGALTPDNLISTPAITLGADVTGQSHVLSFQYTAWTNEAANQGEHFSVYVTTTTDETTIVGSTAVYEKTIDNLFINTAEVDLSAFAGQEVYISFRHHTTTNLSGVAIDNISVGNYYLHDVAVTNAIVPKFNEQNTDVPVQTLVRNVGSEDITSITLMWSDGTNESTKTFTPANPVGRNEYFVVTDTDGSFQSFYEFDDQLNYAELVNNDITVSVTQINGGTDTDSNAENNSAVSKFVTVSSKPVKKSFVEALNGVWASGGTAETSGEILSTELESNENATGVSVHVSSADTTDPFEVDGYAENIGASFLTQYRIDRLSSELYITQSTVDGYKDMGTAIEDANDFVVPATISAETTGAANDVSIELTANFVATMPDADLRFAVILTEDDLSNGGNTYDNVLRGLILGDYNGMEDSILGSEVIDGESKTYTFNYSLESGMNFQKTNVIALLIDGTSGRVLNSEKIYLDRWLDTEEQTIETIGLKAFPNPAADVLNVSFEGEGDYKITITDMLGKQVFNKEYTNLRGAQSIALPVSNLETGNYILNVHNGSASNMTKISIK
ncbi:T9SS type A sorting domain-containing protein [Aureivirga marina]|uniref:T9SS type A sorting domain-containing protein n=1 Tax=Aureivirga marina TaxID=1182451 RepID=UPI0018CAC8BF|nr:T9SS type A sorting domain-containing protein [Aureivirga marina]